MNKIKTTFSIGKFLILFLAISLHSCTTDSEEEQEQEIPSNDRNYIEVGDTSYELSKAFVYFGDKPEEGNETDLYYHEIVITSSDVYVDEANERFAGSEDSHAVIMTVTSSSQNSIPDGTYTVSTWSDGEDFRMVWCYLSVSGLEIDMNGTVTIEQEGDEISVQFNSLTGEDNQEIFGSYSGELEQFGFYIN